MPFSFAVKTLQQKQQSIEVSLFFQEEILQFRIRTNYDLINCDANSPSVCNKDITWCNRQINPEKLHFTSMFAGKTSGQSPPPHRVKWAIQRKMALLEEENITLENCFVDLDHPSTIFWSQDINNKLKDTQHNPGEN